MEKTCKNCSVTFRIREEDKAYYQKIEVPEPTWCPRCREMRKMAWCNEGVLYARTCAMCKKPVVTQFAPENPRTVYCVQCWWSEGWDSLKYGREIDWNRSFFDQIHELELAVPHMAVSTDIAAINSDYTHMAGQEKNCYMIFHATFAEDCYYGYGVKKAKNCMDNHYVHQSELCYETIDVKDCNGLAWSQDCFTSSSSAFLRDCIGCLDCFMCVGLRNKKFCFLNEQLSESEYKKRMASVNLGSYSEQQKYLAQFEELEKKHNYKYIQEKQTENSLGDHLYNAKKSYWCFDCSDIEESAYCSQMQLGIRHCYDIYQYGINAELCYESTQVGTNAYNIKFSYMCLWQVNDLTYCLDCYSSKEAFGCFGLNRKKFCILNKEYPEAEYFELKKRLIEKMTKDGEYGEFFPIKYAHSAYNETMAQMWYPLSKEQVLAKGWNWQDNLPGTYGKETLKELPDDIKNVPDSILQEILACGQCRKNYKIIAQELKFYRQQNYPLPRNCFECRRLNRMKKRNPRNFWNRQCMCNKTGHEHQDPCPTKFYTTYSPQRTETVFCENCYLKEVY